METFLSGLPSECQRIFCGHPFGPRSARWPCVSHAGPRLFRRDRAIGREAWRRRATAPGEGEGRALGRRRNRQATHRTEPGGSRLGPLGGGARAGGHTPGRTGATPPGLHRIGGPGRGSGRLPGNPRLRLRPPGRRAAPVWLSPGEDSAAREALEAVAEPATVATLSCAVPPERRWRPPGTARVARLGPRGRARARSPQGGRGRRRLPPQAGPPRPSLPRFGHPR